MEEQKKHETEILKCILAENHKKNSEIFFIMMKDTHEGVTLYRVYSMLKENNRNIVIKETEETYNERVAKHYFNLLVNTYLRKGYEKIIKWREGDTYGDKKSRREDICRL